MNEKTWNKIIDNDAALKKAKAPVAYNTEFEQASIVHNKLIKLLESMTLIPSSTNGPVDNITPRRSARPGLVNPGSLDFSRNINHDHQEDKYHEGDSETDHSEDQPAIKHPPAFDIHNLTSMMNMLI